MESANLCCLLGSHAAHLPERHQRQNAHPDEQDGQPPHPQSTVFLAMSAMRFNPICKAFAERLKDKGKPAIVIIGAIMSKLLHLIYGVLKSQKTFNPDILKKAPITP
jgi:hypothetical protein